MSIQPVKIVIKLIEKKTRGECRLRPSPAASRKCIGNYMK